MWRKKTKKNETINKNKRENKNNKEKIRITFITKNDTKIKNKRI